jgi:NADH-quinone oxidoreductase subunit H
MFAAIKILVAIAGSVFSAAYLSLVERKVIARIQYRLGPSYTGWFGIAQPIADALKLLCKRHALAGHSKRAICGVCLAMLGSLLSVTIIPLSNDLYVFDPEYGLVFLVIFHAISTFAEILIGLESKSKYGTIGGFRTYLQIVASFPPLILSILCIFSRTGSFNLIKMVSNQTIPLAIVQLPVFVVFIITTLIILHRTPFDFIEAESEIVAGIYTEYGGVLFAMIYLSEYINIIVFSSIISLFLGGWNAIACINFLPAPIFMLAKTFLVTLFIMTIRATLPRYKQQHVIYVSWSILCIVAAISLL